jgi:uncharacterized repeat protein (TIGR01451 family)
MGEPTELPRSAPIAFRWWLIISLFLLGTVLCVAAFVADAHGWTGLGPSALLQFGGSIGLVGVLFIVERFLVRDITARLREAITVNAFVRRSSDDEWDVWTVARPGDTLDCMIRFHNSGDSTLKSVVVGDNLPHYVAYVPGSTWLKNGNHPSGISIDSDNISQGGIDVGHYGPGAVGYVRFAAKVDPLSAYPKLGTYDERSVVSYALPG